MTKLSDNRVGDRLHAALEMIGTEESDVRGNTALIAARQSNNECLLIAAERNSDHVSILMNQRIVPPSKT
jgi:hypothetical protein